MVVKVIRSNDPPYSILCPLSSWLVSRGRVGARAWDVIEEYFAGCRMIIENARDFVIPSCQVNVPQNRRPGKGFMHIQHEGSPSLGSDPPVAEKGLKGRGRERVTSD
ncbi:hypothetical protein KQX54_016064 [Cotesia glomerata]|uniref:Uncharacterized protein n=1 Tax=Cotesia glomerata TaxID=32391 RepID=A0AAV7IN16_COTGL|nr:hypothetical protein KQX54_016064 [Cotesia glomerata]